MDRKHGFAPITSRNRCLWQTSIPPKHYSSSSTVKGAVLGLLHCVWASLVYAEDMHADFEPSGTEQALVQSKHQSNSINSIQSLSQALKGPEARNTIEFLFRAGGPSRPRRSSGRSNTITPLRVQQSLNFTPQLHQMFRQGFFLFFDSLKRDIHRS